MSNVSSPRNDDESIEQEIQRKGLTAPRVTPAQIEDCIRNVYYFTALEGASAPDERGPRNPVEAPALGLLTFCVIVLQNGFTVTGESACASPENFDAEVGRKIARENAKQKIWPLEGYLLKQRLHDELAPTPHV